MKSSPVDKLCIDGEKLSITYEEKELFEFLTENGFFREIGHCEFLSLTPSRSNSLNGIYMPTSVSSDEVPLNPSVDSYSLGLISNLKPSKFLTLILSLVLRTYFPNLCVGPWRSEATNTRRSRACGRGSARGDYPPRKELESIEYISDEGEQTAGSTEFNELDRNDLLVPPEDVKQNRKTSAKSKDKKFEIDPEIEALADEWSTWASSKAMWMKEKLTPDRCYVAFTKIKDAVKYDGKNMTNQGLRELFMFIKKDAFWKDQVLSPIQLLKQSRNGVRKIDNILLSIKKKIAKQNPLQGIDLEQSPF